MLHLSGQRFGVGAARTTVGAHQTCGRCIALGRVKLDSHGPEARVERLRPAAELAAALPSSQVLKAFNTTLAGTLSARKVGSNTTTVLVAGDDDDAKTALISAVEAGGVDAIDAGGLSRARELEAMGFLQIKLAASEKIGWTGGFAVVR